MRSQGAEAAGDIHRLAAAAEGQAAALAIAAARASTIAQPLVAVLSAVLPPDESPEKPGRGYARAAAGAASRHSRTAAKRAAAAALIDGAGVRLSANAPQVLCSLMHLCEFHTVC